VQPGSDLSPLLQLPCSCTALDVGGAAFSDAAVPILLQLTQLGELSWSQSTQFTDIGLEQLTRLDLDELEVDRCSLSYEVCPDNSPLEVKWDPVLVSAASCWCCHALLTLCASATSCWYLSAVPVWVADLIAKGLMPDWMTRTCSCACLCQSRVCRLKT
jgi:hypothetical protein